MKYKFISTMALTAINSAHREAKLHPPPDSVELSPITELCVWEKVKKA